MNEVARQGRRFASRARREGTQHEREAGEFLAQSIMQIRPDALALLVRGVRKEVGKAPPLGNVLPHADHRNQPDPLRFQQQPRLSFQRLDDQTIGRKLAKDPQAFVGHLAVTLANQYIDRRIIASLQGERGLMTSAPLWRREDIDRYGGSPYLDELLNASADEKVKRMAQDAASGMIRLLDDACPVHRQYSVEGVGERPP